MKRSLFVLSLVLLLPATLFADKKVETLDRTWPLSSGGVVTLDNENGAVEIETWDRNEIRVEAKKVVRGGDRVLVEAMKNLQIVVESSSDRISIRTIGPKRSDSFLHWVAGDKVDWSVHYRLTVPRQADLEIETVNGKIEAGGVAGKLRFSTTNGGIEVKDARGSVDASTTNGSIHAELIEVEPGAPMRLGTTNGRITLQVPRDLRATIDASTTNGSIESDLPIETTTFRKTRLRGTVNGGGERLRLSTTNGSIRIRTSES